MASFKAQMAEDEFRKFLVAQGVEKEDVDETIKALIAAGEIKRFPNGYIEFQIGVATDDDCGCDGQGGCGGCGGGCHGDDDPDQG